MEEENPGKMRQDISYCVLELIGTDHRCPKTVEPFGLIVKFVDGNFYMSCGVIMN